MPYNIADMVLVAIGIKPKSELARNAGIKTGINGSISVDRYLQTSDDNIYAAGDCADAYHIGILCLLPQIN